MVSTVYQVVNREILSKKKKNKYPISMSKIRFAEKNLTSYVHSTYIFVIVILFDLKEYNFRTRLKRFSFKNKYYCIRLLNCAFSSYLQMDCTSVLQSLIGQ